MVVMSSVPLTWSELSALSNVYADKVDGNSVVNGLTNAQARLRLFGQAEADVRVTLYRDNHAWCPYCQKVWLWLEEKQIPYRIEKVTMFCYGQKEDWYKRRVPSGMLPAIDLDGRLITESDDILMALEATFGTLGPGMADSVVLPLRQLERSLFRAWCNWLCQPNNWFRQDQQSKAQFEAVVQTVESAIASTPGPYFLSDFSTADVIFTPYVERMNASLYYYKGYSLREDNPKLSAWFDGLEARSTYRGTQSDFHTHVHDLPPQMGGCYENDAPATKRNQHRVDNGPWFGLPDVAYAEPADSKSEALYRVIRHRDNIIRVNPLADGVMDEALRCALTGMMTGAICQPPAESDVGLRYLRDRINVPRDMSIYAAKQLRTALEETAARVGNSPGPAIPTRHRLDQNPLEFAKAPAL
jgi:glutathione S-transferase